VKASSIEYFFSRLSFESAARYFLPCAMTR
jgi:hypothetical protein